MGIALLNLSYERLWDEIRACPAVVGKTAFMAYDYLAGCGIAALENVSDKCMLDFRGYIRKNADLSESQKVSYASALEKLLVYACEREHEEWIRFCNQCPRTSKAEVNKVVAFLYSKGVTRCDDITGRIRLDFENYLLESEQSRPSQYLKALDKLKLESIRIKNESVSIKTRRLEYAEDVLYLQYHPDYKIASSFYCTNNKHELMFDFSLAASKTVKYQIFSILNHVVETETNQKMRHEAYLVPLKKLYLFCSEMGIQDIELMTESQRERFRNSMDGNVGTKLNVYFSIVDNAKKYLFLSAKNTNWLATKWFIERFNLNEDRHNPANTVCTLDFEDIENADNRCVLQLYMRYLIGLTDKAMVAVRSKYYCLHDFMLYCERNHLYAVAVTKQDMEAYLEEVNLRDIQPETFNKGLTIIVKFYEYLYTENIVSSRMDFLKSYYKKYRPHHHDRTITEGLQLRILRSFHGTKEETLFLMFLTLWETGLRLNEVCRLTPSCFEMRGGNSYIYIRQTKSREEKVIPVPKVYFDMMLNYISKEKIQPTGFVFTNKENGPYKAGTFRKQMRQHCKQHGIFDEGYRFRSHDFRHTVATELHNSGVPISVIQAYLGHQSVDMTKQYIDGLQKEITEKNQKYFSQNRLLMEVCGNG